MQVTLEAEPQFLGGTGDLSLEDVQAVRDFVVRNLEPLLAYWNKKLSFDDLLVALRRLCKSRRFGILRQRDG